MVGSRFTLLCQAALNFILLVDSALVIFETVKDFRGCTSSDKNYLLNVDVLEAYKSLRCYADPDQSAAAEQPVIYFISGFAHRTIMPNTSHIDSNCPTFEFYTNKTVSNGLYYNCTPAKRFSEQSTNYRVHPPREPMEIAPWNMAVMIFRFIGYYTLEFMVSEPKQCTFVTVTYDLKSNPTKACRQELSRDCRSYGRTLKESCETLQHQPQLGLPHSMQKQRQGSKEHVTANPVQVPQQQRPRLAHNFSYSPELQRTLHTGTSTTQSSYQYSNSKSKPKVMYNQNGNEIAGQQHQIRTLTTAFSVLFGFGLGILLSIKCGVFKRSPGIEQPPSQPTRPVDCRPRRLPASDSTSTRIPLVLHQSQFESATGTTSGRRPTTIIIDNLLEPEPTPLPTYSYATNGNTLSVEDTLPPSYEEAMEQLSDPIKQFAVEQKVTKQ